MGGDFCESTNVRRNQRQTESWRRLQPGGGILGHCCGGGYANERLAIALGCPQNTVNGMSKSKRVSHWIDQVKDGDSLAANQIWQHYFDRLVRTVRQRLHGQNRAVSDEEDIVLSVFDSFYVAVEKGRFPDLSDRYDLWRLLLRMSARKVVDKRRHDLRQRRGGNVNIHSLDQENSDENAIQAIGNEPTPEMVMMMQESIEQFFSHLGVGQLRDLAGEKLEGYSNAELAKRFDCSERTIERRLHLIREKCQQELVENDEHTPEKTTDHGLGTD